MTEGQDIFAKAMAFEEVVIEAYCRLGGVLGLLHALEVNGRPPTHAEASRAAAAVKNAMSVIRGQHP